MKFNQAQKKRKEHPVDMLANKTKTELLAEAHSAGIKGTLSPERVVFPEKADALFPRCTSHDPTQNN
jgi:hypothetical protein